MATADSRQLCGAEEKRGEERTAVCRGGLYSGFGLCSAPVSSHLQPHRSPAAPSAPFPSPPAASLHCAWTQAPRMNLGEMDDGTGFQFTCSCDS